MPEYYNLTNIQNSSHLLGMVQQTDVMLGGYYFGWFTLFILAFVSFVTLKAKGYTNAACFSVTCWFCVIIGWFLRTMSLLDNYTMWTLVVVTIGSVLVLFLSGN